MNNLLITMSIAGSIPLLSFCLLKHFPNVCISKAYMLLLLSIIFYIFPFPLCSSRLRILYLSIFQDSNKFWINSLNNAPVLSINGENVFWHNQSFTYYLLFFLWLTGCLISIANNVFKYYLLRKQIKITCTYKCNLSTSFLFWKRNISLYYSNTICPPFSTGLFHPIIVLSETHSLKEKYLILSHEKTHIKRCDFIICFLAVIARSIHWFNPTIYLLLNNIKISQEYLVDADILKKSDKSLQYEYGQLILESSNWNVSSFTHSKHVSSLNNIEFKILRERIKRIKNMIHNKKPKSFIALLFLITTVIISMFPLLTYSAPTKIIGSISQTGSISSLKPQNSNKFSDFFTFEHSNVYFKSNTGERTPLYKENFLNKKKFSCPHEWRNGTIEKHIVHSDRSCDIMVYDAKQCVLCGNTIVSNLTNVIHFKVCIH